MTDQDAILQFVSSEEMDEIIEELERAAAAGDECDLDAMQCKVMVALILHYRRVKRAPDPLGEALNSGKGVYRP